MHISGNAFLVTGGASGLGAACVRMLASAGGRVVAADLNEDAGTKLTAEIGSAVRFARADVTDEASVRAAVTLACQTFGGLHGVVQCAGVVWGEKVLGKSGPHALASFAKVIGVNL